MKLYQDQQEAYDKVRQSLKTHRRIVVQAPTAFGKSLLFSEMCKNALKKDNKSAILMPRRELVFQTSKTLDALGVHHGVIMAEVRATLSAKVNIISVDTLISRAIRNDWMPMPDIDLAVIDECHLFTSPERTKVFDYYRELNIPIIGFSATPLKPDGQGLGEYYDDLITTDTIPELQAMGRLAYTEYYQPSFFSVSNVKKDKYGEYQAKSLYEAIGTDQKIIGDIFSNWHRLSQGKTTIVYAINLLHAENITNEFKSHGVNTAFIHARTPDNEREKIFNSMNDGTIQVAVNVGIYTYGTDIPRVKCIVLARPVRSIPAFIQMVGRGLRIFENKVCIIIDHHGIIEDIGRVETINNWSLEYKKDIRESLLEQRVTEKEPKIITCSKCKYQFEGLRLCPKCGTEIIKKEFDIPTYADELKKVEVNEMDLPISKWESNEARDNYLGQLKSYAQEYNKNTGWIYEIYYNTFKTGINAEKLNTTKTVLVGAKVKSYIKYLNYKSHLKSKIRRKY